MTSAQTSDDKPHALVRAGALFHKIEIGVVLTMLLAAMGSILLNRGEMALFAAFWIFVCMTAAAVALWPGVPRGLTIYAELLLLIVALGQWVGARHEIFPELGREIRDFEKWNEMPVTQRRIIAWSMIAALGMFWLILPYAARFFDTGANPASRARYCVVIVIWLALLPVFIAIIRTVVLQR